MNSRLAAGHSADFVAAWRSVHCDIYHWQRQDRFAVVPSLFGAPTFAYLPGLNYADLNVAQARGLAGEMAGRSFNIRTLTEPQGEPPPDTPAVLRVDLAAFGNDRDAIWKQALRRAKRKAVRRARKAGLTSAEETGPAALRAFRGLLSATLVRHGAPLMPAALFDALIGEMGARILVVRDTKGEARASLLWLRDGPLAWVPWSGSLLSSDCPGDLLFWHLLEQALSEGADIVDFGRSSVGSGTYWFKQGFGAVPIPVLWLSDKSSDLYSRYALAQKLWRTLPQVVTDNIGPRLCRYLADY